MPPRRINDLGHFCFRHFVRVDPADAHAVLMNVEHYASRIFARFVEELLKNVTHEVHRRVVVVQDQNPLHGRLLSLRLGLRDHRRANAGVSRAILSLAHVVILLGDGDLRRLN